MRTMAFFGGIGSYFFKFAQVAARRFEKLNNIETRVLDEKNIGMLHKGLRQPAWIKAFLWDLAPPQVERIIWSDADVIPLKALGDLPTAPFSAVKGANSQQSIRAQFPILQWYEDYFNSGFFIATRVSRPVFTLLQAFMTNVARQTWPMFEQSWMNLAVLSVFGNYNQIPEIFNWSRNAHPGPEVPKNVRMLHFPGIQPKKRAAVLREAWAKFGVEIT